MYSKDTLFKNTGINKQMDKKSFLIQEVANKVSNIIFPLEYSKVSKKLMAQLKSLSTPFFPDYGANCLQNGLWYSTN